MAIKVKVEKTLGKEWEGGTKIAVGGSCQKDEGAGLHLPPPGQKKRIGNLRYKIVGAGGMVLISVERKLKKKFAHFLDLIRFLGVKLGEGRPLVF